MRLFTAVAPLMLAIALATPVMADDAIISLTGTGEVTAKPDMALVTSGVVTQAATARDALTDNTKAMAELLAVLKEAGVEAIAAAFNAMQMVAEAEAAAEAEALESDEVDRGGAPA